MTEPHFRQRPWGYDRAQVDAFVERTARRLDEAQSAATPDGAVADALEQVGHETSAVLQRAHEVAAEVTARAHREAAELTERSQREAAELTERSQREAAELEARSQQLAVERRHAAEVQAEEIVRDAEAQANSLDAEIEALNRERQELLDEIEGISRRLHALVSQSDERPPADDTASDDTVEIARAVAARPAGFPGGEGTARAVAASPAGLPADEEPDRAPASEPADSLGAADQATAEMPAAVVAREHPGADR